MIRYNLVKGRREDIQGLAGQMKTYAYNTDSIRRKLRGKISSYDQIGRRLNQISDRIEKNGRDLEHFGEKLQSIVHLYEQSEKRILGQAVSDSVITEPDEKGFSGEFGVSIGDFAVKFSFAGSMESMVAPWWMSVLDSGLLEDLSSLASFVPQSPEEWLEYLGSLVSFVGEEVINNPEWAKALGIIGTVLSVFPTAKDNYKEYKRGEISAGRAVLETGVEYLADQAVTCGASAIALVEARREVIVEWARRSPISLSLASILAAPVTPVQGITWVKAIMKVPKKKKAINQFCESKYGKNASEAISDWVIDNALQPADEIFEKSKAYSYP